MTIHVTPIPKLTDFATPSVGLGLSAAAGSAETVIRSDSTIVAFDTTIPSTLALNHTATAGSASVSSRRDHTHGTTDILLQVVSGEYTGDGAATLGVSGLGIQPKYIVICKKSAGGGNEQIYASFASMIDDNAAGMAYAWGSNSVHGALITDKIRSFDSDGFTVGDDSTQGSINSNTTTYNYVAIGY